MKNVLKLLFITLSVIIVCPAFAQSEGDFNVDLTDDETGVVITGYTGKQQAITIPAKIQGYPVKEIRNGAFSLEDDYYKKTFIIVEKGTNTKLTSVTLPVGLVTIGQGVFYKQSSLTSVNIPASVTYIGDYAFSGCSSLAAVNIPASVTYIGDYAFSGCSKLAAVNFSEGLVKIGEGAFERCSVLKTIKLPNSLTLLDYGAFASSGLTAVTFGTGLTHIRPYTFQKTSIITIIIPEGVFLILEGAFSDCTALTTVTLPSTLVGIGPIAFKGCSALTTVTVPTTLTSLRFDYGYSTMSEYGEYGYTVVRSNSVFDGCEKLLLATRAALKKLGWNGEPLTETRR